MLKNREELTSYRESAKAAYAAQEKKIIKGFSGGMMVHTGYQFGGGMETSFYMFDGNKLD